VIEARGFGRKNSDGRNADRRLANRRLQPLGHLTAQLQVYVTKTLGTKTLDDDALEATRAQIVVFAGKHNDKRALQNRHATRFGHASRAHFWAHSVRL
jgi:hypothetical protein